MFGCCLEKSDKKMRSSSMDDHSAGLHAVTSWSISWLWIATASSRVGILMSLGGEPESSRRLMVLSTPKGFPLKHSGSISSCSVVMPVSTSFVCWNCVRARSKLTGVSTVPCAL